MARIATLTDLKELLEECKLQLEDACATAASLGCAASHTALEMALAQIRVARRNVNKRIPGPVIIIRKMRGKSRKSSGLSLARQTWQRN